MIFVYFFKSKNGGCKLFGHFLNYAENQTGNKVKTLRDDNGGQYVNKEFKQLISQARIVRETSIPHNPEQNGRAERVNRTLLEKDRSMTADSGLEKKFWAEAVATATDVCNRSISQEGLLRKNIRRSLDR